MTVPDPVNWWNSFFADPESLFGLLQIGPARFLHDDGLTAAGLAHVDGGHPSFGQLAEDLIATLSTFQSTGKGEGHTLRRPISSRTAASPAQRRRSRLRPGVRSGPCR